jgi:ANTAR domain
MDAKEPRGREQRLADDPGAPAAGEEMESAIRRLLAVTGASFERRAQLERALATRIEIEQAKGILAERFRLGLDDAFELLRTTARRERRPVHDVAHAVIDEPETPIGVLATLDRGAAGRPSRVPHESDLGPRG